MRKGTRRRWMERKRMGSYICEDDSRNKRRGGRGSWGGEENQRRWGRRIKTGGNGERISEGLDEGGGGEGKETEEEKGKGK